MGVLPAYPQVSAVDDLVFIEHEDGKRDCWGREATCDEAARVAAELELGLRLISYVRHAVDESLGDIRESLESDAPAELVEEVLIDDLWQRVRRSSIRVS